MKVKLTRQIRGATLHGEAGMVIDCAPEVAASLIEAQAAVPVAPVAPVAETAPEPPPLADEAAVETAELKARARVGKAAKRVGRVGR